VIDYNVKPRGTAQGSGMDLASITVSTNPCDEIAVEEPVHLKAKHAVTEVSALYCGAAQCQHELPSAMATGADRAILVETDAELQPLAVVDKLLKALPGKELPGLLILGEQSIDDDCNQARWPPWATCRKPCSLTVSSPLPWGIRWAPAVRGRRCAR